MQKNNHLKTDEPNILEINLQFLKEILITNGISQTEKQAPIISLLSKNEAFIYYRLSKKQIELALYNVNKAA